MEKPESIEEGIDLLVYLKMLQKWKWLIAGITLLAVVTSGILSFFVMAPVYQSKTVIMVKEYQDPKATQRLDQQNDLESAVNSLARLPQMTIQTYVDQIENEALLRDVIKSLNLDAQNYSPDSLRGLIDVKKVPDTNLIELSVKNTDPQLAARIANTTADKFLEFVGSSNEKQLVLSADFLTKQLEDTNKELTQATNNLNKSRNQPRNVASLEQDLLNQNKNLIDNQSQLLLVEADYQEALAGKSAVDEKLKNVPDKITVKKTDLETGKPVETEEINPVYAELSQMETQKTVQLAELEARRQSVKGSVEQLQIELKNLQADLSGKREAENQLLEKVEQIKKTRDVLAEKLTQVQIIKSVNQSQNSLQIVTPAFSSNRPVSPKKMQNVAVALVLGLMASVGLALLLEFTNNTINKPEDVDQHLDLPLLGTIPFAKKEDF
jgi:capsular polysaccharide biosynthesis protein